MKFNKIISVVFVLCALLILLFVPYSCKKIPNEEAPFPHDDLVQKFFLVPENASSALKNVIKDIMKQDEKNHFVTTLANRYGLPAWNKTLSNIRTINDANARGFNDDCNRTCNFMGRS